MCANSAEVDGTEPNRNVEEGLKSLTETHSSALTGTQPQFLSKTAKPLFIGSIPITAFCIFNKLRAAEGLPVVFGVPVVCQLSRTLTRLLSCDNVHHLKEQKPAQVQIVPTNFT